MNTFFQLYSTNNYSITSAEKLLPLAVVFILIVLIYRFRIKIKSNINIDKYLRSIMGYTIILFLGLYYIIEWTTYGIKPSNLPLHLCFLSAILCSILCFSKSKLLFNIVAYGGILGGLSSLLFPVLDLSWKYFRYYEFMTVHGLIIIIPIYFMIIYNYWPSCRDTIDVILILQGLAIILGIFNEIYKTNYMFVSFTSNFAAEGSILQNLGSGFDYIIKLELFSIITIIITYLLFWVIKNRLTKKV